MHPTGSTYRTLKRIVVDGLPVPGVARPWVRTGLGCDDPLQLAAWTGVAVDGSSEAAVANKTATTGSARCEKRVGNPVPWGVLPDGWEVTRGTYERCPCGVRSPIAEDGEGLSAPSEGARRGVHKAVPGTHRGDSG